jgi:hypothetical protein
LNRPVRVAFILDRRSAGAPDRARHATAQLQVVVGRVDDRIEPLARRGRRR